MVSSIMNVDNYMLSAYKTNLPKAVKRRGWIFTITGCCTSNELYPPKYELRIYDVTKTSIFIREFEDYDDFYTVVNKAIKFAENYNETKNC